MVGSLAFIISSSDLTPRNHNKVSRQILRERMEWHARQRVPKHFNLSPYTTPGGFYRYNRRSRSWRAIKARFEVNPDRPNVWSGWLMRHVLAQTGPGNVRATATRATWTARGADAGFYRGVAGPSNLRQRFGKPHPLRKEQAREIEAVSPDERASDAKFFEKRYVTLARRPEFRRQRRRKIG